ncbi:MAG: GNAT family N-acetyltransferase [Algicola sp.]|nr:GNAT family N-acetyltransferase [Algicola sp.]
MNNYTVKKYQSSQQNLWNTFVSKAENSTFLFQREFMEYHKDRFEDFSLLVFKKTKLLAVLPANKQGTGLISHQGLSYGGLVVKAHIRFEEYCNILKAVLLFLKNQEFKTFKIKTLPFIYNDGVFEAFNYLTHFLKGKTVAVDSYYVIDNLKTYKPNRNRNRAIQLAKQKGVCVVEEGLEFFWEHILTKNLKTKYHVNPVHTIQEITYLKNTFPNHIKAYFAKYEGEIVAGALLFVTKNVVHFQYSSGNDLKDQTGALDFLFDAIIQKYAHYKYISFGSSSTDKSLKINAGLAYWKESFGAKIMPQTTYEIDVTADHDLNTVFL